MRKKCSRSGNEGDDDTKVNYERLGFEGYITINMSKNDDNEPRSEEIDNKCCGCHFVCIYF